jgi:asparagine synthase (glutamine-hydrolysing)
MRGLRLTAAQSTNDPTFKQSTPFGTGVKEEIKMSVQAGIWNFEGEPVDRKILCDFSEFLMQQGPDGEFLHVNGSMAMLYRPFHTTAESRREKQPYRSQRGFILTWDGRLDNRDDLIGDVRGDLGADPTDVEIVAAAFDRWETGCLGRIIGDWAVSIWSPQDQELLFAVDYMAIRHIFYYPKQDGVWWASDLTPLVLLSGTKFHIDDNYIAGYFAHDPAAHLTPYREIREVPSGQLVRVRKGMSTIERHWHFSPKSRIRYKTDREYEEHFRYLFRQSVRRRLRSDSSILAELSGGVDSSSIVCMADDILAREGAQTPRLDSLSYHDDTEPSGDDSYYFRKIEEKRGRVGSHIDASKYGRSVSLEYTGFSSLPGHLGIGGQLDAERSQIVKRGNHRAILSGFGGDELLGGVPNPTAQLADLILRFKFPTLFRELLAWSLLKRRPWPHLLWDALLDLAPTSFAQHTLEQGRVERWIERVFAKRTCLAILQLDVDDHFGLWLPTRRSCIATVQLLANGMAKRLASGTVPEELRYPYLDQDLVEYILSLPATQVLRPGERRSLMRRALESIVPQEILSRRTKQVGARTPLVALAALQGEISRLFQTPVTAELGIINGQSLLDTIHAACNGQVRSLTRIFKAISLELWIKDLVSRDLLNVSRAGCLPQQNERKSTSVSPIHDLPSA